MTTSYGPVREVMFAPTSDVTDVNSFLIRDDAYARSSAVLGRTLRLGDPIDTGVVSAAYQTSWSGGREQTIFNDTSMYLDGDLDTTDKSGRLKLWSRIEGATYRNGSYYTCLLTSPEGNVSANNKIIYGTNNSYVNTVKTHGSADTYLENVDPGDFATSMTYLDQSEGIVDTFVAVGTANGKLWYKNVVSPTGVNWVDISHPTVAERAYVTCMVTFNNKIYLAMGNTLWSRDYTTSPVWTKIKSIRTARVITDMVVVGNTIYLIVEKYGQRTGLYVSDGSSVSPVYELNNSFPIGIVNHNGSIYISVREQFFVYGEPTVYRSALYVLSGSSLRKIHSKSSNKEWGSTYNNFGPIATWGDFVALGFTRMPEVLGDIQPAVGVLLYRPDTDSFHIGPSIKGVGPNVQITTMKEVGGTVYMGLWDGSRSELVYLSQDEVYLNANMSYTGSIFSPATLVPSKRSVVSSSFDANLPDQNKTWLRVNVKHYMTRGTQPYNVPTLNVYVKLSKDEYDSTKYLIGSYTPPIGAVGEWKTSSFDIAFNNGVSNIKFPISTQLKYVIEISFPIGGIKYTYDVFIDSVSVEYMLVATPKKVWRSRVLCEDDQLKLNNVANVLDTRQELVDKLFQYWGDGQPLYYWDASPASVTPTISNYDHIVMITDIGENSYRVDDRGEEVNSEVSLTMYEVG